MVKETRHIFDLSDIKAIRIQCGHCKGETLVPPTHGDIPLRCQICEERLVIDAKTKPFSSAQSFVSALRTLLEQERDLYI